MPERLLNLNKSRLLKIIIILLVGFAIFMVFYFPNYAKLKKLKEANRQLLFEIDKLDVEIEDLEEKINRGEKDSFLLEKFVRNELGAAKKEEIVIDILE
ncbi:MAG: septum formation initiator family protein [Candidatus Omnitrophota bacterium]|nr:MAG: septum formation initiator family protein [Candidatus Omnitrophota bacterium]